MAIYDNSRYTYSNVLNGTGFYKQDDSLKYSAGVKTMQEKLNKAGFWCGTPDGKFGGGTDEAVRHFQRAYNLTVDGAAGKGTLTKLDSVSAASPGFNITTGDYGVYFDNTNKRFLHNQQVVYERLKKAGLSNIAIAGFMGNLETEHAFKTALSGTGGSIGLAQWTTSRKANLENYAKAISQDITSITVQTNFILEECKSGGTYSDSDAVKCLAYLKDSSRVNTLTAAADYVTALYERCTCFPSWAAVEASTYSSSRFSKTANTFNKSFYLDTPKRRGYTNAYYNCIIKM